MSSETSITRRELLVRSSLVGGGLWLTGALPLPRAARAAAESNTPVVLDPPQWQTLEAITARLIPTDRQPGAREAGCVNFIDKALAEEEAAARPLYDAGLAGVAAAAKTAHAKPFSELSEAEQDTLLASLQEGRAAGWPAGTAAGPSPVFFETLRVHTILGFLSHPKYGGNREYAGWRVTGYPGPRHHRGGYTPDQVTGQAPIDPIWGGSHEGGSGGETS